MKKVYVLFLMFMTMSWAISAQLDSITNVTLTFTPETGDPIVATATGGVGGLASDGAITLMESSDYTLRISVFKNMDDITSMISADADNHQIFYQPMGSVISGDVGATDTDSQGLPLGLENAFTTECTEDDNLGGMLRVVLADLTGSKSMTSTIADGTALFDINWEIIIEDDASAPPCENEEEIITDVILTFTPVNGGDAVTAAAQDPDGEGPLELEILGDIELEESTEYTLTLELTNGVEGEDITEEIMEEDDEHMFFFAFTDEVFASPAGDGNLDNREGPVNYNDFDENGLPVGLNTTWTTECGEASTTGTFRVVLKHQPDIKSATSSSEDGGTDVDLTWTVNVSDDPEAPPCESEEEIITDVILTWAPVSGGDTIIVSAQDPDGEGPLDLEVQGEINLDPTEEYTLTLELLNAIEGEDITEEIMEEDHEHLFFFAFTEGVFSDPSGDGNADNRSDVVRYNDFDENNLPVGLSTSWSTEAAMASGTFRVVLKHQPDTKSATSTIDDGGTDVDLTWPINNDVVNVIDIEQQLRHKLSLAPNPVSDMLRWQFDGTEFNGSAEVRISSLTGHLLKSYASPEELINVSELPAGIYVFQLRTEGLSTSKRFIKLR